MTTPLKEYAGMRNLNPGSTIIINPDYIHLYQSPRFGVIIKNAKNLPKITVKYAKDAKISLGLDVELEGIEGYSELTDPKPWIEIHEVIINIWMYKKPNLLSRIKRFFQG